jgi:hypothetical protein
VTFTILGCVKVIVVLPFADVDVSSRASDARRERQTHSVRIALAKSFVLDGVDNWVNETAAVNG